MMIKEGALIWITGLAGSGKTTIGNCLYYNLKECTERVVILDGDILKNIVDSNVGYSIEDRKSRAYKYAALCKALVEQEMIVICCTIAMFEEVRQKNRQDIKNYVEVFLDVGIGIGVPGPVDTVSGTMIMASNLPGFDMNVEFPKHPDLTIVNDGSVYVKDCVEEILKIFHQKHDTSSRDVLYWNDYYASQRAIREPSMFAKEIAQTMEKGKKLLDVGCGNGRDSEYFLREVGLHVTGIDISDKVIQILNVQYADEPNAMFVCDDFTRAENIYAQQYDYIYSRFSLHAINLKQENDFLSNAYKALKTGGRLYVEVRSVKDFIFGKGVKVGDDEYIYDGHYRRFLRKEELEQRLMDKGFTIVQSIEDINLAPFGSENPSVIRMVCEKSIEKNVKCESTY